MPEKKPHQVVPPVFIVAALGSAVASAAAGVFSGVLVFIVTLLMPAVSRRLPGEPRPFSGLIQAAIAAGLAFLIPLGPASLIERLLIWGSMLMLVSAHEQRRLFVPCTGLIVLAGHAVARNPAIETYALFAVTIVLLMAAAASLRFPLRRGRAWAAGPAFSLLWLLVLGVPVAAFAYVAFPRWQTGATRDPADPLEGRDGGPAPRLFADTRSGESMLPLVDLRYGHEMLLSPRPVFYAVVRTEGGGVPSPSEIYGRLDAHAEYRNGRWKQENRVWTLRDQHDGSTDGWVRLSDARTTIRSDVYPAGGKTFDRLVTAFPAVALQLPAVGINREGGLYPAGPVPRPLVSLSGPQLQYWDMALGARARHADPRYTDVSTVPGSLRHIAQKVAGDAPNASGKIRLLRNYLIDRCRFSYRFAATGRMDPVEEFVIRRRQGSCSCFASALTLMLRAVGVPSRLATGYTGGYYDAGRGLLVVRECDAHAWVEVYFDGIGWLPVEATPSTTAEAFVEGTGSLGGAGISFYDRLSSFWTTRVLGYSRSSQRSLLRKSGLGISLWMQRSGARLSGNAVPIIVLTALFAAALLLGRYLLRLRSYTRGLGSEAPGGMRRLLRALGRMGLRRRASETWLEFADALGRQAPDLPDLRRVFGLYCALRYGAKDVQQSLDAELEQVVSRLPRVWYPT